MFGGSNQGVLSGVVAYFGKTGSDDDSTFDTLLTAFLDHRQNHFGGYRDHGRVYHVGDVFDRRVGFVAKDLGIFGVDGINAAFVTTLV